MQTRDERTNQVHKINKMQLFNNKKCRNSFPLTQCESGLNSELLKRLTVQIQSKKIRYSPDPVQTNAYLCRKREVLDATLKLFSI